MFIQNINWWTKTWPHFLNCSQKAFPIFFRAKQVQDTRKYIDILKRHSNFGKPQIFKFQRKRGPKVVNCKGHCKTDIVLGDLRLKAHNMWTIPYSKGYATVNSSYVCARKDCVIKTPLWVYLVVPPAFLSSLNVFVEEKAEVVKEVDITF